MLPISTVMPDFFSCMALPLCLIYWTSQNMSFPGYTRGDLENVWKWGEGTLCPPLTRNRVKRDWLELWFQFRIIGIPVDFFIPVPVKMSFFVTKIQLEFQSKNQLWYLLFSSKMSTKKKYFKSSFSKKLYFSLNFHSPIYGRIQDPYCT